MRSNQKRLTHIILIMAMVVIVILGGYFLFVKKIEESIINQPAYLIAAYSKNRKNYIEVDYVEWLHDEYSFPNGYKQNQNPEIKTFEISPLASITVNGTIAFTINETDQTHFENPFNRNLEISFKKFANVVSSMKSPLPYNSPFKEPKTFVILDVKDTLVTKIVEPYQE